MGEREVKAQRAQRKCRHWASFCAEEPEKDSEYCFLHEPGLSPEERENAAKRKGWHSLKQYVESKVPREGEEHGYHQSKNLRGAQLAGINLREADLRSRGRREQGLHHFDMQEAVLQGADLSKADMRCVNLKRANLGILEGSGINEGRTKLAAADLREALLFNAQMKGAILGGTDLRKARLCGADLREATVQRADLRGADLTNAKLDGIRHLDKALIDGVQGLTAEQCRNIAPSAEAFRAVKRLFLRDGNYRDAGVAAYWEKREERREKGRMIMRALKSGVRSTGYSDTEAMPWPRDVRALGKALGLLACCAEWAVLSAFEVVCGYCEKPWRALLVSMCVLLLFAGVYWLGEGITPCPATQEGSATVATGLADSLYFSVITFTTLGYGDVRPVTEPGWFRFAAGAEAALGAVLTAVFIVSLAHRYVGR